MNDAHPAGDPGLLEVRIARKEFVAAFGARLHVLRDVAFALRRGEVGAFVGPSGCGKTTMLRIVAGLDDDYEGSVVHPPGTRIGMVFQEPRLLLWRTVEQNVRLFAPAANEAKLADLFEVLGLAAHRSHYPGELSVGLARRVALARAFSVEPDLLVLDEPFISLDHALAERLRDELASLVDRWCTTTLLVTHDVGEAVRLGDRIFLLSARPAEIIDELVIAEPRALRSADRLASITGDICRRIAGAPAATEPP